MRNNPNRTAAATLVAAAAVLSGLASCKGRTMDNMEPTGETIEVNIENPDIEVPADTLAVNY